MCLAFINQPWFVSCAFGNTLWLVATSYYIYITFLGYSCEFKTCYDFPVKCCLFLFKFESVFRRQNRSIGTPLF